ncbi:MAG TPA: PEP-CTERM sorting domain-containing protein [Phycisphaerae bacterium]|nr:PEP-CTERM sorting domain-containing protein [Phycisphaerae bacterium]
MRLAKTTFVAATLAGLLAAPVAHAAIILNFFPASDFNANTSVMDAALGITGFTIDTFEQTALLPGLTISLSGGVTATTWTSLPNLFDTGVCGSLSVGAWDGTHAATNSITNLLNSCTTPTGLAALTTFNYAPGPTSFGIALSNFQSVNPPSPQFPITNHELFVNGVDLGVLETLAGANWSPGIVRNAYLRIDTTGGSTITSVGFQNLVTTGQADFLAFDRLAVLQSSGVPEPGSGWLLFFGAAFVGLRLFRQPR